MPLDAIRPHLPDGLRVISVRPGRTLGCLYVASYRAGSVLTYDELIVLPALVRRGRRVGFWVSHIYVDDAASMAGGRALWNLPKEMARFDVEESDVGRVVVTQGDVPLATIERGRSRGAVPMPVPLPAFGSLRQPPVFFVGRARARLGLASTRVEIPAGSPLARLGMGRPFAGISLGRLDLHAAAPNAPTPG